MHAKRAKNELVFYLAGMKRAATFGLGLACVSRESLTFNHLVPQMKLVFMAAAAALFSASCCPKPPPAPNKPAYVQPSK